MSRIYLTGENQLTLESLKNLLKRKGYDVLHGRIVESFRRERMVEVAPDIIFWDSDIIEARQNAIFEFLNHLEISSKSIFVISSRSLSVLGTGLVRGIQGFVHKSGGIDELEDCINALENGEKYISPLLAGTYSANGFDERKKRKVSSELTKQEKKILKLVNTRKTSKEIAQILDISYKTVQNHRYNICQKLGLKGRWRLIEFADSYFR